MTDPVAAPVRESVGAALRFARTQWRAIAVIAVAGAAISTAISMTALGMGDSNSPLSLIVSVLATFVSASIYAALLAPALQHTRDLSRLLPDSARVWSAMLVVGFFLVVVMFALLLPAMFALQPLLAPYAGAVQAAGQNEAALMALGARFAQENPGAVLGIIVVFCVIMLLLTSRFYLAAPASLDAKRILTFETWAWTKNNMLRIAAARIMLLGPALVLSQTLSMLFGRAMGVDAMQGSDLRGFAAQNPAAFAALAFVSQFVAILLYNSLEAGLAASFYRVLKPAAPPRPI